MPTYSVDWNAVLYDLPTIFGGVFSAFVIAYAIYDGLGSGRDR